jgi:HSP20 family protein
MRLPANTTKTTLPTLFDDFVNAFFDDARDCQLMAVDVIEKPDVYEVKANFPGLRKDDIGVSVKDGEMVISARQSVRKQEEKSICHLRERYTGQWRRVIRLPENANPDQVAARLEHGVLTVIVPKIAAQPPRQVTIE